MTYALRFLPEVEEDTISVYLWYEAKALHRREFLWRKYTEINEKLNNLFVGKDFVGTSRDVGLIFHQRVWIRYALSGRTKWSGSTYGQRERDGGAYRGK